MTKKTVITSLSLLLVLVLLIVGYKLLKDKNARDAEEAEAEEAASAIYVNDYEAENLKKLSYRGEDADLSFEKDANGSWKLSDDFNYPIDSSKVANMANAVSSLRAVRLIESEETPDFGFESPVLTVSGEYSDGAKLELSVGAENEYNGNVYLKDMISGKIYMIESGFKTAFDYTKESLMLIDEFPGISDDLLVSLEIRDAEGVENTVTDETGLKESAEIFRRLSFSSNNAFYATDEELKSVGITPSDSAYADLTYGKTVSLTNDDGTMSTVVQNENLKIVFGKSHVISKTDDDGSVTESNYYYYTAEGSHIVYSVSEAVYNELMRYSTYVAAEFPDTSEND